MGYPLPEVGGLSLKPNSKAYALIVQGDTKPLVAQDFDGAIEEQFILWELTQDNPDVLISIGKSPLDASELVKQSLVTLEKIAKSCVGKARAQLNQDLSEAEKLRYERVLDIQRACEKLVTQALNAVSR